MQESKNDWGLRVKLKIRTESVIDCSDWDKFVKDAYGKPYCFQQQDGCKPRGTFSFKVPDEDYAEDFENDAISEVVNGPEMGVSFEAWKARDPKEPLKGDPKDPQRYALGTEKWAINLWWERNFYPELQTLANDLHNKGLLNAGSYTINIDW